MLKKILIAVLASFAFSVNAKELIRIYVPVSPGGIYDTMARIFSEHLENNDIKNVVENVTGAGGLIALEKMATMKDKKILLVVGESYYLNAANGKINSQNYTVTNTVGGQILFFYVNKNKKLTCKNFNSTRLTVGTAGKTSNSDIIMKTIKTVGKFDNIDIVYYKGLPDAFRDVLSNNLDATLRSKTAHDGLRLESLFNTGQSTINGVPSIYDCLGIKETFRTEVLVLANSAWEENELNNINSILNNFIQTDKFDFLIKNSEHFVKYTPKLIPQLNQETANNIQKFKNIIKIMDLN